MLTALKYREIMLEKFYLNADDITIHRNVDGYLGRYKKHDIVKPYALVGENGYDYRGVHVPGTRTSISLPWLLTVLRKVPFSDNQIIDHEDGDITNNSRTNIRVTTQLVNRKNSRKRCDNTSGHTGISYNKKADIYTVRKTIKGKRLYKSSKTLSGAVKHLEALVALSLSDGYTDRHGKEGATTIPKGSTLQAIGSGSARHPA